MYLIVDDVVESEGFGDLGDEGGSVPVVAYFVVEEFTHGSLEFWGNGLRFVADVHFRYLNVKINTSYLPSSFSALVFSLPFFPASASILMKVVFPVPFSPSNTVICDVLNVPSSTVSSKSPCFL